jgi:predicted aldo/keto reductase-like oxidoreductase
MGALEQVKENQPAAENALRVFLSEKELALYSRVRDMYLETDYRTCTGCDIVALPQGVNIPENSQCFNELYMFDNLRKASVLMNFLPKESRAEQCINCGHACQSVLKNSNSGSYERMTNRMA